MDESLTNRAAAVEAMRAEVDKSNTEARQVAALRKTLADSIAGANFLSDKKRNSPLTIALLDDLSRRLPEDTYLERLQIENGQVQLQGQSKEAAKLIALLSELDVPGRSATAGPDPARSAHRQGALPDHRRFKACNSAPDAKSPPGIGAGEPKATADAPLKPDAAKTGAKSDTIKADAGKKTPPGKEREERSAEKGHAEEGRDDVDRSRALREQARCASLAADKEAGRGGRC